MDWKLLCIIFLVIFSVGSDERVHGNVKGHEASFEANASAPLKPGAGLSNRPIFIIVSFDGFRYDYFSKADTPNLDWVKANGVFASYMKPQFPTKTFPNHHSIVTGLHTETHGVVDNKIFDPLYNATLGVDDKRFWVYDPNVVPLWVLNEWVGGVSGVMMWPGSLHPFGHNETSASYIVNYNTSIPFKSRIDTAVSWVSNVTNPANLVFLYFEEPDGKGHAFGPDSAQVKSVIEQVDQLTGYLIAKLKGLKILEHVNLVFLSDHGFEAVHASNIINISSILNPFRYSIFGGSPNYHLQPANGEEIDPMYEELKAASATRNFSVYKKEDMQKDKPHWHYSQSRRITPILLFADLGFVFDDFYKKIAHYQNKFNASGDFSANIYGTHGYDNHLMHMSPFFRAYGPAFATGLELEPFNNIDLFPFLCELLHIPTPPNNGSSTALLKALAPGHVATNSSILWITGGGVLIGFAILFLISSYLFKRRKSVGYYEGRSSNSEMEVGYRYQESIRDGRVLSLDENRNGGTSPQNGEERALLSLSDESLQSPSQSV